MNDPAADVHVRVGRPSDEADLVRLDRSAWSARSGFPSVIQRPGSVFFAADSPPDAHLIGVIHGVLAGYIRLKQATPLPESAHVIGVFGLAVAPEARRRGVASALLAAAEHWARDRKGRKLSLRVLSSNDEAIRLYLRCGFQREGVLREEFFIDGSYVDDIVMSKFLT